MVIVELWGRRLGSQVGVAVRFRGGRREGAVRWRKAKRGRR